MALFVLRYISCMLIFVIGLKAPAIISHVPEDTETLINDANTVRNRRRHDDLFPVLHISINHRFPFF